MSVSWAGLKKEVEALEGIGSRVLEDLRKSEEDQGLRLSPGLRVAA